jgi:N-acetylneuraminate synthase
MRNMHCLVIAEAGVNHDGSPDRALEMVETAARAGADVVKFQTFKAERIASPHAPKAGYQKRGTPAGETQLEMLKRLELGGEAHRLLLDRCSQLGVEFLSTPFDLESLRLLLDFGVSRLKLPSGEITNGPLLLEAARSGLPLIVSTGMSTLGEVEAALGALAFGCLDATERPCPEAFARALADPEGQRLLLERVTLLHCTTEYPAPFEAVNLLAMDTLGAAFGLPVGYSDHTTGIAVALAAAARGAVAVEKHFTLDKNLPGPDHAASLDPAELQALVQGVRQVRAALGSALKIAAPCELANRSVARKSLAAARAVRSGSVLSPEDIAVVRPGTGRPPMDYWRLLGTPAPRDYQPGELLE